MRWVLLLKPKLIPQREGGGSKWHLTVTRNQSLVNLVKLVNLVRSNIRIVSTCISEVSWAFLILVELQTNLPLFHEEIKKWKVLLASCTGKKRKAPLGVIIPPHVICVIERALKYPLYSQEALSRRDTHRPGCVLEIQTIFHWPTPSSLWSSNRRERPQDPRKGREAGVFHTGNQAVSQFIFNLRK